MKIDRQTILEVSVGNFKHNIKQIQDYIGNNTDIMPVTMVKEAIELRKMVFKNEIFVLNQPYFEEIEDIIKYNVTVGVCSLQFINEIGKYKNNVKAHLELETGMGRTGVNIKDLDEFIQIIKKNKNVVIEGVYTHFSSADCDKDYTNKQIELFIIGINKIKDQIQYIKYIHSSASNGILNYNVDECNLVRPGMLLYGYKSSDNTLGKIDLKPVAKLKSKISFVKEVEKIQV